MKRPFLAAALPLLLLAGTSLGDTSTSRILDTLEAGGITEVEAIQLLVASVVTPELLPLEYIGSETDPCGTPALHEAVLLSGRTGVEVPEILILATRPTLSGPEYTFNSPDGHFKLHWTDQGVDATTLAYAQQVAGYADISWQVECNDMGYFVPPPDGGVGGDNLYDIYIAAISSLGYTSSGGEFKPPDSTHACSASHIVICRALGESVLKATVAHEFQHAVQMSYDYNEPTWFMENCAVWMEEQVFPEANDYIGYLHSGDNPLRKPWWDIRSSVGLYWYGGVTFTFFISGRVSIVAVREIWENCADVIGNNMLTAQEDMFEAHGMTWEQGFEEYACWRWFTAANWYSGSGIYFPECALWTPGPYVFPYHNHTTLPASGDEGVYETETYGIHWIKVSLANYQNGWVEMAFNGRNNFHWNLGVIMWNTDGDHQYAWYDCDPTSGDKTVAVSANGWDYVIFAPAFMSVTSLDHYYEYDITFETGIEEGSTPPALIDLRVASNPLSPGDAITFELPSAGPAQIRVYDLSGRTAAVLFDGDAATGTHTLQFGGEGLSTGTYFITLTSGGQEVTRKVVLAD
jgi:hypothetical protein